MTDSDTPQEAPYGPQTAAITRLLSLARAMTPEQAERLADVLDAAWGAALDAALDAKRDAKRDAMWGALWEATRVALWEAKRDTTLDAMWGAPWDPMWYSMRGAALALLVWDLIGQHGLTQDHLNRLIGPAKAVFGDQIIPADDRPLFGSRTAILNEIARIIDGAPGPGRADEIDISLVADWAYGADPVTGQWVQIVTWAEFWQIVFDARKAAKP
jgi:hypothetical protein